MSDCDEELFSAHFVLGSGTSNRPVNMTSVLQTQNIMQSKRKTSRRSFDVNISELRKARTRNVKEVLSKTCKPLSVSLTKLPKSKLTTVSKKRQKLVSNNVKKQFEIQKDDAKQKGDIEKDNVKEQDEVKEDNIKEQVEVEEDNGNGQGKIQEDIIKKQGEIKEDNSKEQGKIQEDIIKRQGEIKEDNSKEQGKIQEDKVTRQSEIEGDNLKDQVEIQKDNLNEQGKIQKDDSNQQRNIEEENFDQHAEIQEGKVEREDEVQKDNTGRSHIIQEHNVNGLNKTGVQQKKKKKSRCIWETRRKRKPTKINITKTEKQKNEGDQCINSLDTEHKDRSQAIVVPVKQISKVHKQHTQDLLKSVRQPYIRLRRIDEVINKIAQTFAKVTTAKECKKQAPSQQTGETQTESSASIPISSVLLSSDDAKHKCLEINESETNECVQSEKAESSDSDDFLKINKVHKGKFKKKRRVIYYSDDDSSESNDSGTEDLRDIISREVKRLKSVQSKKTVETPVTNEDHTTISRAEEDVKTTDASKQSAVQTSSPDDDVSDKSHNLSDKENVEEVTIRSEDVVMRDLSSVENISPKACHNDVDVGIETGCASSSVSSQLDFMHTPKRNVHYKLQDSSSVCTEEPVSKTNDTQQQTPFVLDEHLIDKYKLLRDLKVFLINFDTIRASLDNPFSATEVEQVTEKYMNFLMNSNFINIPLFGKILDSSTVESVLKEESVPNYEHSKNFTPLKRTAHIADLDSDVHEDQINDTCVTDKDTHDRLETPVGTLNRFSSSTTKKFKVDEKKSSECRKVSRNLTELWENNFFDNSDQNLTPSPSKKKSSLSLCRERVGTKSSSLSPTVPKRLENGSANAVQNLFKSSNKAEDTRKAKTSEVSPHKESSMEPTTNAKDLEKTDRLSNYIRDKLYSSGNKTISSKVHSKSASAVSHSGCSKKNSTAYSSFYASPVKYKKTVDSNKSRELSSSTYRCIVCDLCFEDYSILQQHLTTHTQKQNTLSSNNSDVSTPASLGLQETVPCSSETESLPQNKVTPKRRKRKPSQKKETSKSSEPPKKRSKKRRRYKRLANVVKDTNECSICSQIFSTKYDLASHIFLHTERELKEAFAAAQQKLQQSKEEEEKGTASQKNKEATTDGVDSAEDAGQVSETSSSVTGEETWICSESLVAHDGSMVQETTASSEAREKEQTVSASNTAEKPKANRAVPAKKAVTICECHNQTEISGNCLQIEIVLLCHTCRILFRSMECLETHYRLPEHSLCNQHRLENGRSPNLFCANCGMIFNSVQELRHHLEVHARFKQTCIMDFRCNICKVIFIGIGSLFYIHWSKHAKNPFFIASEQSFPKNAVIKSRVSKKPDGSSSSESTEVYIHVAEHVCLSCKSPFVTEDQLKKHELQCKVLKENSTEKPAETSAEKPKVRIGLPVKIRLICSLCDVSFNDKARFYEHTMKVHKFGTEPQFVCVSLKSMKTAIICSVCMEIMENMYMFKEHWLSHNTTRETFACTHCETTCDSVDSFMSHAKCHRLQMRDDAVACNVTYREIEFVCKRCNIGFICRKSFNEHNVVHKINVSTTSSQDKQTSNEKDAAPVPIADNVSAVSESSTSTEKQTEKSIQSEVGTASQATEKKKEDRPTKTSKEMDREKLISILEGNEDDSEHELVIDLSERPEDRNHASKEDRSKEKQSAANVHSDEVHPVTPVKHVAPVQNTTISTVAKTVTQTVPKVSVVMPSESTVTPATDAPASTTPDIIEQLQTETISSNSTNNLQSVPPSTAEQKKAVTEEQAAVTIVQDVLSTSDAVSSVVQEESTAPPKRGFIRVRTLAELLEDTGCCNESSAISESHGNTSNTFDTSTEQCLDLPTYSEPHQTAISAGSLPPQQPSKPCEQPVAKQARPVQTTKSVPQERSGTVPIFSNFRVQQRPANTEKQGAQHSFSAASSTAAYHKNLPACNILRTKVAIPRSALIRREKASVKTTSSFSNVQNVRPTYTTSSSNAHRGVSSANNATGSTVNSSPKQRYVCHICPGFHTDNLSDYLVHQLSETHNKGRQQSSQLNKQNASLSQPSNLAEANVNFTNNDTSQLHSLLIAPNQSGVTHASSPPYCQYPYYIGNNSTNYDHTFQQSQPVSINQPVPDNTSSFYYSNPNGGGMSIVINQTAHNVHSTPVMNTLQPQGQGQLYQPPGYSTPMATADYTYVQQPQTVIDLTGSRAVYQVVSPQCKRRAYAVTVRPPAIICSYCPKTVCFLSEQQLQMHIDSAHTFVCNVCGQRFHTMNELSVHSLIHKCV